MILEVNKFKRESASRGSRVPFALLTFEYRSIKLLKQKLRCYFLLYLSETLGYFAQHCIWLSMIQEITSLMFRVLYLLFPTLFTVTRR